MDAQRQPEHDAHFQRLNLRRDNYRPMVDELIASVKENLHKSHRERHTWIKVEVLLNELKQHCSVVLTVPGMYSYSIWSGVAPIEEKRINSWPFMWPDEVLREDLPKLQEQSRACVLVNRSEYEFFKGIAVWRGNDEILSEIQKTMRPLFIFETSVCTEMRRQDRFHMNSQQPKQASLLPCNQCFTICALVRALQRAAGSS